MTDGQSEIGRQMQDDVASAEDAARILKAKDTGIVAIVVGGSPSVRIIDEVAKLPAASLPLTAAQRQARQMIQTQRSQRPGRRLYPLQHNHGMPIRTPRKGM
mgnify:CR=1 FL=1